MRGKTRKAPAVLESRCRPRATRGRTAPRSVLGRQEGSKVIQSVDVQALVCIVSGCFKEFASAGLGGKATEAPASNRRESMSHLPRAWRIAERRAAAPCVAVAVGKTARPALGAYQRLLISDPALRVRVERTELRGLPLFQAERRSATSSTSTIPVYATSSPLVSTLAKYIGQHAVQHLRRDPFRQANQPGGRFFGDKLGRRFHRAPHGVELRGGLLPLPGYFDWEEQTRSKVGAGENSARRRQAQEPRRRHSVGAFFVSQRRGCWSRERCPNPPATSSCATSSLCGHLISSRRSRIYSPELDRFPLCELRATRDLRKAESLRSPRLNEITC